MKKRCCCNKNDESCEGIFVKQGCCYVPNLTPRESWVNIDRDYSGAPFQSSPIGGTPDGLIRTQLTSCGGGADWSGNWYDETIDGGGQFNGGSINGLGIAFGDQSKDLDGKKCQTICVSACTILDEFLIGINDTDASLPECVEVEVGSYDDVRFGTSQADWTLTILPNGNEFWCPNIENTWIQFVIQDKQNFCFKWTQHDSNQAGSGSTSFFQAVYHDKVTKFEHTCTKEVYYELEDGTTITELPTDAVCQDLTCHGLPSAPQDCVKTVYYYEFEEGVRELIWSEDDAIGHRDVRDIFTGPPNLDTFGTPSHPNTPTIDVITASWANANTANDPSNGNDQALWAGYFYAPQDGIVIGDASPQNGERFRVWLGDCCSAPKVIYESPLGDDSPFVGGVVNGIGPFYTVNQGWHLLIVEVADRAAFSGFYLTFDGVAYNGPSALGKPKLLCKEVDCNYELQDLEFDCIPGQCQPSAIVIPEGEPLTAAAIIALVGDHPDQEICTGDFVDISARAGFMHPVVGPLTANTGTVIEDWIPIGTSEISPDCDTDITVNGTFGNTRIDFRNSWVRVFYDVRLLVNGAAVATDTLQSYIYQDDIGGTNLNNNYVPAGSFHFSRSTVPAGATIVVETRRRYNFVMGSAATAAPTALIAGGLRAKYNVHYSPIQIVTGRV